MEEVVEGKEFSFPREEEKVLSFWTQIDAFKTQLRRTEHLPEYIFYDGPPFATGLPHYGHILAGTIKDIVTRYQTMTGHHVTRRFGWDCHGLPIENLIDKKFGIKLKSQVLEMGIDKYNEECRSVVDLYVEEWEKVITRSGRWIDFKKDYKTMDLSFMESVWWVFAQLFDKNLIYKGFKVMPYSTGLKTPLSSSEAKGTYKKVSDPEAMVTFPVIGDQDNAAFVAWTTTPWTLPCNLALCVNPEFVYLKVRNKHNGRVYVVAEPRLSALPSFANAAADTKKANKGGDSAAADSYEILEKFDGASLVGKKYEPLFDYFSDFSSEAFRVVADDYVTDGSGTGIVHCAPAFGEDDYRVCLENNIVEKGEGLVVAVDEDGLFTERITHFFGRYVKDADKDIIEAVKAKGRLVKTGSFTHEYPFCPRSDTPLLNRALPSWFMRVDEQLKEQLLENTKETHWVPSHVKDKRFHNWLENARDWCISRSRFWGTPLPIWISDDGEEVVVMDSVDKLEKLSGVKVFDLHRHHIDQITIPSSRGPEFGVLRRVEDVFDCWFESGSMPYAYIHYPFENKELFEKNFPGDFVAEGLDQTRGWYVKLASLNYPQLLYLNKESIHYCSFPEADGTRVERRIEQSVTRMMTVIDLARNIRERHKLPLKTPLKEITVVHPDADFLDDITGKLREYVLEELNVRSLVTCNDTLKYASLKAEPDFSVLGKRLGKSMRLVAKEVKEMSQQDILRFEEAGKVTIAGHTLELTDIKIVRVFKRPDGLKDTEIDANGDGDVLVLLDLRPDDSLYEAGVAREIVNRVQKLRKKSGLEPTDVVEVYIESLDKDESVLQQVLSSQEQYIKDTIGSSFLPPTSMPSHAVILSDESFQNVSKLSFKISLARPALKFN
ncbi:hypothetical protein BRARA_C04605 [Brassica rapa]|uniref:isoleucine--tRNA ligase n=1 Tax=Brassica campestris TaxID=3711 RepID=A0A398ABU1_BRACM|nr:hypothetical protein BRARA_C04605 [Brassica rapa]